MMPNRTQSSTHPGQDQILLLSFSGDLTTKADATRRQMTRRLIENLRTSINQSGRPARVKQSRSRLYVELEPPTESGPSDAEMVERFTRIFGVQSVSLTHAAAWHTLEDVVREGLAFGEPLVRAKRFAIRARRMGERHEVKLRSAQIQEQLGAALKPGSAGVDLSNPDVTLFVEVDTKLAYYFVTKEPGVGGLPLGSQGRAVSLLSGGFDSPVASWRMLRRGVALDYVFCNLGGRSHQLETLAIAKRLCDLWQCGTRPCFHAVDFDLVSREIQRSVTTRYWQIVLKRMMLRAAAAVAERFDALAIVTGDAIGQVSSQTLTSLGVVSHGTELPILRPLVGDNKQDIIAESRRVGTHNLSEKVGEYCAIVPSHPATSARLADVLAEEAKLDPSVLARALAERSEFMLCDIDLAGWDAEGLCARELLPGEILIDLRSRPDFDAWHAPGALLLDFANALRAYSAFDTSQRYVLYCEWGLKSAHLADLMRRAGLAARHVSGGVREMRRLAAEASGA